MPRPERVTVFRPERPKKDAIWLRFALALPAIIQLIVWVTIHFLSDDEFE
jgi:hypothetical protein